MKRKKGSGSLGNKGLIVCGVIAVALCVWTSVFHFAGGTDVLREGALFVSSPFVSFFDSIGRGVGRVSDAFMGEDEQKALFEEQKKELENQLAVKELEISRLQSLEAENEQLRAYLELKESHPSLVLMEARTIYTSDTSLRSLTLDKGSSDGIEVGMPVLDTRGLVGVVSEVFYRSCRVQTIMDEALKVGVRDARSGITATLSGAASGQSECAMSYMDPGTDFAFDLAVGDVIVTSGGSDIFPEGLVVGRISRLDLKEQMPTAYVSCAATLDSATSLLMIVTGEVPEDVITGEESEDNENEDVTDKGADAPADGDVNTENNDVTDDAPEGSDVPAEPPEQGEGADADENEDEDESVTDETQPTEPEVDEQEPSGNDFEGGEVVLP